MKSGGPWIGGDPRANANTGSSVSATACVGAGTAAANKSGESTPGLATSADIGGCSPIDIAASQQSSMRFSWTGGVSSACSDLWQQQLDRTRPSMLQR